MPINITVNIPLQILENIDMEARILSVGLLRAPPQKTLIDSENELNIATLIPTLPPCVQIHFLILQLLNRLCVPMKPSSPGN